MKGVKGYALRLRVLGDEVLFGPGVNRLLRLVEQTGSLQTAADAMGMSYSKARKIVRAAEKAMGFPFLERRAGGAGGGFSRLTADGSDFMARFEAFEKEVLATAEAAFQKFFS